jgi:hypothetical protein
VKKERSKPRAVSLWVCVYGKFAEWKKKPSVRSAMKLLGFLLKLITTILIKKLADWFFDHLA